MIRAVLEKNGNMQELRELLALQKEWEANEAMKEFNKDLAVVHQQIEAVVKTKINPQTKSKYAELDEIITQTKPLYTKQGFSVIFYEGTDSPAEHVRVCADLVHRLGHKQHYHFDVPLDGIGIKGNANMTKIHAKASSVSYGRRYLMCMIFNIPTSDDTDGNNSAHEVIDQQQLSSLLDMVTATGTNQEKFLKFLGIDTFEDMPKSMFDKAMSALKAKEKKAQGTEGAKK
ncbi:MAG TPA: ERF family protein [Blastocatellia bacterium]|nr:ERF family protein [Blastocatellia bacterium]